MKKNLLGLGRNEFRTETDIRSLEEVIFYVMEIFRQCQKQSQKIHKILYKKSLIENCILNFSEKLRNRQTLIETI